MKYCPSCQITYADESLRFCLQDGTGLRDFSGNEPLPTVEMRELETVVRQTPVTSGWEPNRVTQVAAIEPKGKKSNTLTAVIVTVLVMFTLLGASMIVWRMLGSSISENANGKNKISSPTVTPAIDRTPTTPYVNEMWQPIDFNASLNGERLTYYRGTTPEQCQADCAANPNCKAFTLIRAGAYNPPDPPMCYLMSKVTGSAPHSCCISGIKK